MHAFSIIPVSLWSLLQVARSSDYVRSDSANFFIKAATNTRLWFVVFSKTLDNNFTGKNDVVAGFYVGYYDMLLCDETVKGGTSERF